jgi:hypothetical protein
MLLLTFSISIAFFFRRGVYRLVVVGGKRSSSSLCVSGGRRLEEKGRKGNVRRQRKRLKTEEAFVNRRRSAPSEDARGRVVVSDG